MSFSSYFNNNVYSSKKKKKKPANVLTEKREARARAVVAGARAWQLSLIREAAARAEVEEG